MGLTDIEIVPSNAPEDFPKTITPFEYVLKTAESKALAVYEKELDSPKGEPALVIAADTVVVGPLGEILEKPRSEKHHVSMLQGLRSSGWHKVYTAVVCMSPREDAVTPGYYIETQVEVSTVLCERQSDTGELTDLNRKPLFVLILPVSRTTSKADSNGKPANIICLQSRMT